MDRAPNTLMEDIRSGDRTTQGQAFEALMRLTEVPVDWAYAAWDDLLAALEHRDNRLRAIAAQILCNLAKSDPERRMLRDFDALLKVTRDERFVTARHCLLSLWKIGAAGPDRQLRVVDGLAGRFAECAAEKNCSLIRFDIVQGLRRLYDRVGDESIRVKALGLIETEPDPKYRKKYAGEWRK